MTFHVIDKRTGKEPIFDGDHIFRESWCKGRLIECDIDGWYISEDGQLALVDDCCNMAYPPPDKYEVVYDIERYAEEHNLFICSMDLLKQIKKDIETRAWEISISDTDRANGMWDVYRIIDEYIKRCKE